MVRRYCDADWGTSDSRLSITGNIFRYNGALIQWIFKLQKSVSFSTVEAKYYSASLGRGYLSSSDAKPEEMGFEPKSPTPVNEDNTACIESGHNCLVNPNGEAWRHEYIEWTNNVIGS